MLTGPLNQIIVEAIKTDTELQDHEKDLQMKEKWLSKSQFDNIVGSCKEEFINACSLGIF